MSKGFTLVEVIVSIAVFLLIIGVGVGIFVSIVNYQRSILLEQELFNQISYAEEHIAKSLRMAQLDKTGACLRDGLYSYPNQNYLLIRPDTETGFYTGIKFLNASDIDGNGNPACQEFYLDMNTHILREKKTYFPYAQISDSESIPLTSEKIIINSARFGFDGASGCSQAGCPVGDQPGSEYASFQPRITMVFNVLMQGQSQPKIFQTTISQRNLNAK